MSRKFLVLSIAVFALLILTAAFFIFRRPVTQNQAVSTVEVTYPCKAGASALELLQQSHSVEVKDSSLGKLVTAIDGRTQADGKYWLYSVDAKEATIGAEAYICQESEMIEWELK